MLESRRLANIVFADIAGYSALMQADELNALSVLDRFQNILETTLEGQAGQIVQYYGDGCLLSFDSAFVSVQIAMELQQEFIKQQVPVRVGMHLGDVVFVNDNVFGDGVNIASRIESLGVPGAVLLSKSVRDLIKNKTEFVLIPLGAFHFKNIAEPMDVFAVGNPGFVVPEREQMEGKLKASSTPQVGQTDKQEWERFQLLEILDALEDKKCVLILGNYAFSKPLSAPGTTETELFLPGLLKREQHRWLSNPSADDNPDFFTSAQKLIEQPGGQRMFMDLTRIRLEDLGPQQQERFQRISEIPFDLILSTYPYDLVHEVFTDHQIPHQYASYSYLQEPQPLQPFTPEYPLLYNLFGSTRHKESMVISLDRLYQFIFAILGVRQVPKLIQDKVRDASHLVFLGFSFDDWYMKLLLRVLKVHEKEISYAHPPGAAGLDKGNRKFFESNFKVTFLEKQIDEFIAGLHELCREADMLRTGQASPVGSTYDHLQELIDQYRLEEALQQLDELIIRDGKEGGLLKELGDFQLRFYKIAERAPYDHLSKTELDKEKRQLRNQLSMFVDRVSESIPA